MRVPLLMLLLVGYLLCACNKNAGVNNDCETACKPNRACTEEFRSLMVEVVNSSGAGVQLDSFKVIRTSDKKIIFDNIKWQQPPEVSYKPGIYLIFSDSYMQETSVCGTDFEFKGYLKNRVVANRTYRIVHDCCHIHLTSGDIKITIDE